MVTLHFKVMEGIKTIAENFGEKENMSNENNVSGLWSILPEQRNLLNYNQKKKCLVGIFFFQ